MQYKQLRRILTEILLSEQASAQIMLAAAELLLIPSTLPKLGPYKKRSPGQLLWRLASDSTRPPKVRWRAVQKLLEPSSLDDRESRHLRSRRTGKISEWTNKTLSG